MRWAGRPLNGPLGSCGLWLLPAEDERADQNQGQNHKPSSDSHACGSRRYRDRLRRRRDTHQLVQPPTLDGAARAQGQDLLVFADGPVAVSHALIQGAEQGMGGSGRRVQTYGLLAGMNRALQLTLFAQPESILQQTARPLVRREHPRGVSPFASARQALTTGPAEPPLVRVFLTASRAPHLDHVSFARSHARLRQ